MSEETKENNPKIKTLKVRSIAESIFLLDSMELNILIPVSLIAILALFSLWNLLLSPVVFLVLRLIRPLMAFVGMDPMTKAVAYGFVVPRHADGAYIPDQRRTQLAKPSPELFKLCEVECIEKIGDTEDGSKTMYKMHLHIWILLWLWLRKDVKKIPAGCK